MRFAPLKIAAFGGFSIIASLGFAQGLFSVPNGDTLKGGTISTDLELDGGPQLRDPRTLNILAVRYGVCDRLTVGEDLLLTGTFQGAPNFSLGLYADKRYALAGGYENVGVRSFGEQPYVTGSAKFGLARAHIGWTRSNHSSLMLGAEYAATDRLSLMADTITGRDNFTTVGAQYGLTNAISLTAGFMHANDRVNGDGVFLDLNWTVLTHGTR